MTDDPTLKTTKDGSHTLYSNRFGQHYHNPNGAVAESKHNFFETNGLNQAIIEQDEINILEIGFGTGLNLLLLLDALRDVPSPPKVSFHSIEAYPVSAEIASSFNFGEHLHHPRLVEQLSSIFNDLKSGSNSFELNPHITAHIFCGLFDDYAPGDIQFDFILHDAFSPDVNQELWTGNVFKELLHWSDPKALLTTYSAASKAKGAMAWAGWKVAKAPGALGKREMTVASPSAEPLSHLKRVNEERLARRYEESDF